MKIVNFEKNCFREFWVYNTLYTPITLNYIRKVEIIWINFPQILRKFDEDIT